MLEMPSLIFDKSTIGDRIAFFGPMVSGKTYCANALKPLGYEKFAFADKLKEIAEDLYGVKGKNGNDREVLQKIGEYLRAIDPEVWIKYLLLEVERYEDWAQDFKPKVVVDDLRYANEAKALKDNGFLLILVTVPKEERERRLALLYPETPASVYYHDSEKEWEMIPFDDVVYSSVDAPPVVDQIKSILELEKLMGEV